nr:MAG TPA: hypothetical protein [Caudoviricetes sp.]
MKTNESYERIPSIWVFFFLYQKTFLVIHYN